MIGYYDQEQMSLNPANTIFDEIHDSYPQMNNTEIRNICATFLFKGDDVFKTIDVLSGGEKGRIVLMKLLLHKDNFLILDEPTNHLDIQSKEVLEDALLDFPGTILFISHDRYFINKIATRILDMSEHGITEYKGDYAYYLEHRVDHKEIIKNDQSAQIKTELAIDRKTKNKIKSLEREISQLEEEINHKTESLNSEDVLNDYQRYNDLTKEIEEDNQKLEDLMEEWEELNS